MKRLIFFLSIIIMICNPSVIAQITTQEYPPSFYEKQISSVESSLVHKIAVPKLAKLKEEDKIDDEDKSIPWRFGAIIPSQIDLKKDWEIKDQGNGYFSCYLSLFIEGAFSLNLNLNDFHLSPNAELFIYDNAYNDIIGALTEKNNKSDQQFSTRPIFSEKINLELIVPKVEYDQNRIFIHEIVYGYRNLQEKSQKAFKSSGNCNINVNCEEGEEWQEIKRSVAMITTNGNSRFCSGVLVNNVRQDSTPYLLTGAHCDVETNSIFVFGYESEKCNPNTDGILTKSISGAFLKAVSIGNFTDFELVELSSKPPNSYGVHYAGWSAFNTPAQHSTVIHHPLGDVKKISFDQDSATTGNYRNSKNKHWVVGSWEKGTTERGSSGSPLFNQNQRIVGLLHGGDAECGNFGEDYFGKIAISWNTRTDSTRQLRYWLDPDTTGTLILDGLSTDSANFNHDLQLVHIGGVQQFFCDTLLTPIISVRNIGNDTIFSIDFKYNLDGGIDSAYTFQKTLLRNELISISLPPLIVEDSVHVLKVTAFIGNVFLDQNLNNNSKSHQFISATNSSEIEVTLMTDDYGIETSWSISDVSSGIRLHTQGPYTSVPGGLLYKRNFCVPDTSCMILDLFDSQGDGFNGTFGNGYLLVKNQNGDTLLFEDDFTTAAKKDTFCLNTEVKSSLKENMKKLQLLKVFPNPITRGEQLKIEHDVSRDFSYSLFDTVGRIVLISDSPEFLIPKRISKGLYYLQVSSTEQNISKSQKIIIQ